MPTEVDLIAQLDALISASVEPHWTRQRPWSPLEDQALIKYLMPGKLNVVQVAKVLRRTPGSVQSRRQRLKFLLDNDLIPARTGVE